MFYSPVGEEGGVSDEVRIEFLVGCFSLGSSNVPESTSQSLRCIMASYVMSCARKPDGVGLNAWGSWVR